MFGKQSIWGVGHYSERTQPIIQGISYRNLGECSRSRHFSGINVGKEEEIRHAVCSVSAVTVELLTAASGRELVLMYLKNSLAFQFLILDLISQV